ncbi:MAG: AraC family transcriptional regulator [Ruminococcaceae bacterium]|nr:AraC family transcriptional regulator [Oscillospiraceae bacterium]
MYPYFEKNSKNIFISHKKITYNFPSHFHNHLEIAFCVSGMQNVKVGEKIYTLKKGDAIVIFPNTVHEYIEYDSLCDEPTEIVAIICNTKLLAENLPDIITKYPRNPFIEANLISEGTALAFRKIITRINDIELIGWTYIILSDLLSILELTPTDENLELPSKIVAYIDANFKEDLTINHISKAFGYHPSYITHLFCDRLKIPFRTYLGSVRSEYAASQIRATEKSLTEIAFESGYNSLNTFCRCFKKHFSQTPSQYKKACRSKM